MGEACDVTAYRRGSLITRVAQDKICSWEKYKPGKDIEKVTMEEKVKICVADLLCNALEQSTLFQRKHSHCLKSLRGVIEVRFSSKVNQCENQSVPKKQITRS